MIERILDLNVVMLFCENVIVMKRFYTDVMHFSIYREDTSIVEIRVGSMLLGLAPIGDSEISQHRSNVKLAFRVAPDEVRDIESYLTDKGVDIIQPTTDDDNGKRLLQLADPEGNLLEIYAEVPVSKNDGLLSKLTFEQVIEISEHCELQTFRAGQAIVNQGDLAEKFYIITRGHVKVVNISDEGKEILIGYLHEGDYFGEVGLLQSHPRTATIRAADNSEVHVIAIDREGFSELLQESEIANMDISQAMYDRLMEMAETIIRNNT